MDGCRIMLVHVVLRFEEVCGGTGGFLRKGEHLETAAVESEEILVDEAVSGQDVIVQQQVKNPADPVITVKGDAVSIAGEDQEDVKEKFMVSEAFQEPSL